MKAGDGGWGERCTLSPVQKVCRNSWCQASFEVTPDDLAFYEKMGSSALELRDVPPPTRCPNCRQQRRLVRRNERSYHKRPCSLCRREMLSMYPADAPFPVYCSTCWWSDKWHPLTYGYDIDFSHPFLEQFLELQNTVPRITLYGKNNENCEYINHSVNSKNCYLCVDVAQTQDTYFSKWMIDCHDCSDCYQLEKSELCCESQYSVDLNRSIYAFLCDKSSNLAFCYDCEGCQDCLLCSHLRHKHFCIQNKQLTVEEYRMRRAEFDLASTGTFQSLLAEYFDLWKSTFHREQRIIASEDCSGDFIYHCRNVHHSFGVIESRDCAYCYDAGHMSDCQDAYEPAFNCELQYDAHGCNGGKRLLACHICYDNDSLAYCDFCHNSSHLFGCIGLKRQQYCILNKQYEKSEYETLVPKIIDHMRKDGPALNQSEVTGSWGEFFPVALSPFAYNDTLAQEYFPLSKEEAAKRGLRWRDQIDEVPKVDRIIPAERLPDSIDDIPDDVLNWAIRCEVTKRPFRIVKQELAFYRKIRIPIPRLHPDERHRRRMAFTNPRTLWLHACQRCQQPIQTTYAPDRPEIVYCEKCYLETVY